MEELRRILPERIVKALLPLESILTEVRLRANCPVCIETTQGRSFLRDKLGTVDVSPKEIERVVMLACENSVYAYNDQIRQGFLSLNGLRIGLGGQAVLREDRISTLKNFSSLNLRVIREVRDCAKETFLRLGIRNLLVVSPPGAGKTTFLRDYVRQITRHDPWKNIFVADERNELLCARNGTAAFPLNVDYVANCPKGEAFENAVRSLNPDIVVTDEITDGESGFLRKISLEGITVLASAHASNAETYLQRDRGGFFQAYVVLSKTKRVGTVEGIYDAELKKLW